MKKRARLATDIIIVIIGTALTALGIHTFISSNAIGMGGVTGIAIVLSYLTKIPIGIFTLVMNVPMLFVGFRKLGKEYILKTAVSVVTFTVVMDYLMVFVPIYTNDKLMASIFGGVIMGIGYGLIYWRGAASGGMDIAVKLVAKRYPYFSMGNILTVTDIVVIAMAVLVYKNIDTAMYAIIVSFVYTRAVNTILYGRNPGKLVLIVSKEKEAIRAQVLESMNRGLTLLQGRGAYTGNPEEVIMCAVPDSEFYKLKRIVNEVDENAFLIVVNSNEIMGKGFQHYSA